MTSTEGDIHLQNTQVKAKDTINLDSAQHIVLESGQSQEKADGKNSNAGLSVGYGVSVGAKTGVYIYGEAGYGKGSNHQDSTSYNPTTLESDRLNIKSKGDTTLAGATATANRIDADVGGKLRIESLQDKVEQNMKQTNTGGRVQGGLGSAWEVSGNVNKSSVNGHYNAVNQQSGLSAGDGGFNIKVQDNTHLEGAYISSTASKDKNQLTTGTLTVSNIDNEMSASAKSQGITLSKDMLDGSKYGAAKGLIRNNTDQASKAQSDHSTTYSAISPAQINITNAEQQLALTGQTVDETVQSIRTDTDGLHRSIDKVNVSELQQSVEQDRANKMAIYSTAELFADEAHKTMFIESADTYEVERDKDGKVIFLADGITPKTRKLTAEELTQLEKSPDGTVHIAVNGIFNDKEAAARYALQNDKGGPDQGRYFIHFPKTNNFISELLVAGYQKNMENDFFGLTNSSQQLKGFIDQYRSKGLTLTGHSRGTMTIDNTFQSLLNSNLKGQFPNLYSNMVGAAANVNLADQKLAKLQEREKMDTAQQLSHEIQYQGHWADAVSGSFIGQNTPTGGENLPWYMYPVRVVQMFGDASVHSCYGSSNPACQNKPHWSDSPDNKPVWKPASQSQLPLFNRIGNSVLGVKDK